MSYPRGPEDATPEAVAALAANNLRLHTENERLKAGLAIATRCLHKFSWEGSSVNFPARMAMNAMRDIGLGEFMAEALEPKRKGDDE